MGLEPATSESLVRDLTTMPPSHYSELAVSTLAGMGCCWTDGRWLVCCWCQRYRGKCWHCSSHSSSSVLARSAITSFSTVLNIPQCHLIVNILLILFKCFDMICIDSRALLCHGFHVNCYSIGCLSLYVARVLTLYCAVLHTLIFHYVRTAKRQSKKIQKEYKLQFKCSNCIF